MRLFSLGLACLFIAAGTSWAEQTNFVIKTAKELIPGLVQDFPVKFLVPGKFSVASLNDEFPGLDGGVIWGPADSIAKVKKTQKLSDLDDAIVIVKISDGVMQSSPKGFSIEDNIKTALPLKDLVTRKSSWNGLPVLSFKGLRPNGTVAVGAWVGLNSPDQLTFLFDFRGRSKAGKLLEEDQKIWNALLEKTSAP